MNKAYKSHTTESILLLKVTYRNALKAFGRYDSLAAKDREVMEMISTNHRLICKEIDLRYGILSDAVKEEQNTGERINA